jgi:hypothetical protein
MRWNTSQLQSVFPTGARSGTRVRGLSLGSNEPTGESDVFWNRTFVDLGVLGC